MGAGKVMLRAFGWLAAIAGVIFVGTCVKVQNDPQAQARIKDREAIRYCESEHQRLIESGLRGGALELSSQACDLLRADFRRKWNREP